MLAVCLHAEARLAAHAAGRLAVYKVFAAAPEGWSVSPRAVLNEYPPGAQRESKGLQEARFLSALRSAEPVAAESPELAEALPVLALPARQLKALLQVLQALAQAEAGLQPWQDAKLVFVPPPASFLPRA